MDLKVISWESVDWFDLADDTDKWLALVNTVMNLRVTQNAENFLNSSGTVNFSRRTLLHEVSILMSLTQLYIFLASSSTDIYFVALSLLFSFENVKAFYCVVFKRIQYCKSFDISFTVLNKYA
jgi:hypothetical protein